MLTSCRVLPATSCSDCVLTVCDLGVCSVVLFSMSARQVELQRDMLFVRDATASNSSGLPPLLAVFTAANKVPLPHLPGCGLVSAH